MHRDSSLSFQLGLAPANLTRRSKEKGRQYVGPFCENVAESNVRGTKVEIGQLIGLPIQILFLAVEPSFLE